MGVDASIELHAEHASMVETVDDVEATNLDSLTVQLLNSDGRPRCKHCGEELHDGEEGLEDSDGPECGHAQEVDCDKCQGAGEVDNPHFDDTKTIECDDCDGLGLDPTADNGKCGTCKGTGNVANPEFDDAEQVDCDKCEGSGQLAGPHEAGRASHEWLGNVRVTFNDEDDSVYLGVRLTERQQSLGVTFRRMPDYLREDPLGLAGRVLLHLPHPGENGWGTVPLAEVHKGTLKVVDDAEDPIAAIDRLAERHRDRDGFGDLNAAVHAAAAEAAGKACSGPVRQQMLYLLDQGWSPARIEEAMRAQTDAPQ